MSRRYTTLPVEPCGRSARCSVCVPYLRGDTLHRVADRFGCSPMTVYYRLLRDGTPIRGRPGHEKLSAPIPLLAPGEKHPVVDCRWCLARREGLTIVQIADAGDSRKRMLCDEIARHLRINGFDVGRGRPRKPAKRVRGRAGLALLRTTLESLLPLLPLEASEESQRVLALTGGRYGEETSAQ
jgi:hypothetical protein